MTRSEMICLLNASLLFVPQSPFTHISPADTSVMSIHSPSNYYPSKYLGSNRKRKWWIRFKKVSLPNVVGLNRRRAASRKERVPVQRYCTFQPVFTNLQQVCLDIFWSARWPLSVGTPCSFHTFVIISFHMSVCVCVWVSFQFRTLICMCEMCCSDVKRSAVLSRMKTATHPLLSGREGRLGGRFEFNRSLREQTLSLAILV